MTSNKPPGGSSRRQFLRVASAGLGLIAVRGLGSSSWADPFDREMEQFMQARNFPGGALAVVKDHRLVYTRGYGLADREQRERVRPDSLFRIASVTKPITAVAVLALIEDNRLSLEDTAWSVLDLAKWAPQGTEPDERLKGITIRQLLQHTGGWDRDRSFDPMFRPRVIARQLGVASPPGPRDIIRYMLGQPLDFDPGTRHAYSNFGYCLLGRVIEKVSGLNYDAFVRKRVLAPAGIVRMHPGETLADRRAKDEVRYYTHDNAEAPSVFDSRPGNVPWPYGGFCLESMDAHGGWLGSAVDLARFASALDDPQKSPLLKPETFRHLYAPPPPPVSRNDDGSLRDAFYAAGWLVRPVRRDGKANYWHNGSLPGTSTLLVRRWDGLSWAALFNQRSGDKNLPDVAIDPALHRAADAVDKWPEEDLFRNYFKPVP
jgi:CubicO group peptidase (beta-lactamase class C family)